jgi:hypothetical protein
VSKHHIPYPTTGPPGKENGGVQLALAFRFSFGQQVAMPDDDGKKQSVNNDHHYWVLCDRQPK